MALLPPPHPMISWLSPEGTGVAAVTFALTAYGSQVWSTTTGAANTACYVPIHLNQTTTIKKFWVANGSAAVGNFDIGIYNSSFAKLTSTGSTAFSGTTVLQFVDVTDYPVTAGVYWLAMACDNASSATQVVNCTNVTTCEIIGARKEVTAFPLPATATPATYTGIRIPVFGISLRSSP